MSGSHPNGNLLMFKQRCSSGFSFFPLFTMKNRILCLPWCSTQWSQEWTLPLSGTNLPTPKSGNWALELWDMNFCSVYIIESKELHYSSKHLKMGNYWAVRCSRVGKVNTCPGTWALSSSLDLPPSLSGLSASSYLLHTNDWFRLHFLTASSELNRRNYFLFNWK